MKGVRYRTSFVLEWSPRGLRGYDSATGTTRSFANLADVAAVTKEVLVAVGRRTVFLRTVRVPNVGHEEVRQVLLLKMADLFPIPPQDLAYDFELTDDTNAEGRLALVAAVPSAELRKLHADAKAAGLKIVGVVPGALGSAFISTSDRGPYAVVEETVDGTVVDIVAKGIVRQSRLIATVAQLDAEVCRTFGMVGLACGPIIAAGGKSIPGAESSVKESSIEAIQRHLDRIQMDIEPPEVVANRVRYDLQRKQRLAVLTLVAGLALGAFAFLNYEESSSKVRSEKEKSDRIVGKAKKNLQEVEAKVTLARAKLGELDRGFRPAQRFGDVTALIANRAPAGVWLTGITVERGKVFAIRGTATTNESVAAYLRSLSLEPRLRDVRLVFANNATIDDKTVVQFSMAGFPVGNLPLLDDTRKKR